MSVIKYEGEYNGKQIKAEITVVQAGVYAWMTRTRLQGEAELAEKKRRKEAGDNAESFNVDLYMLRHQVYPDLIAAAPDGSIEVDGKPVTWPPSFETFFEVVPFPLIRLWQDAVYSTNPEFFPELDDDQKKML
jgi:hypothetical protein